MSHSEVSGARHPQLQPDFVSPMENSTRSTSTTLVGTTVASQKVRPTDAEIVNHIGSLHYSCASSSGRATRPTTGTAYEGTSHSHVPSSTSHTPGVQTGRPSGFPT